MASTFNETQEARFNEIAETSRNVPFSEVMANPWSSWNWDTLTQRSDISPLFMLRHPQYPWNPIILTERAPLRLISRNPEFQWIFGTWDINTLSNRQDLPLEFTRVASSGAPLNWNTLSSRLDIPIEFILHNRYFEWNWELVQHRPDCTPSVAVRYPQAPLDWKILTSKADYALIIFNKSAPWDQGTLLHLHPIFGLQNPDLVHDLPKFMMELPLEVLDEYITAEDPLEWDWALFTRLRCSIPVMLQFPYLGWDIREFVRYGHLTMSDIVNWGGVLLRKFTDEYVGVMDAAEDYLERMLRGDENAQDVEFMTDIVAKLIHIWNQHTLPIRDADGHYSSDSDNEPDSLAMPTTNEPLRTRLRPLRIVAPPLNRLVGQAGPQEYGEGHFAGLADIPAGSLSEEDDDENPFVSVPNGPYALAEYPSVNVDSDEDEYNDPMGYRLQYRWGHRQLRAPQ
jgi:hypothetical protein